MSRASARHVFDVLLVGYGPAGVTLAGLLGREGLRVGVIERSTTVFPQPRAVGFDHDAMRIFQRIGAAQALMPSLAPSRNTEYIGATGQPILYVDAIPAPYPLTWAPNYSCDQPGVEATLRATVATMETVQVMLGSELVSLVQHVDHVEVVARDAKAAAHTYRARYVVGCDGASSPIRRILDIQLESLDYDEPWIVVDVLVEPAFIDRLPAKTVQYCEPERPSTHVVCPGSHRRWEFMVLPGEPREGALDEDRLWRLLERWLKPGEARIWRAAAYRFHALVAHEWQRGRVFLAGDSAHQTPPFMGQGMCQGVRDAGNLAWKLTRVLRGASPPALLETYTPERRPHVIATTQLAKDLGRVISERDPQAARARDQRMLAEGGGTPRRVVRQSLIPGLTAGLIAPDSPAAGRVFPQPVVFRDRVDRSEILLDEVHRGSFRVILDGRLSPAVLIGFAGVVIQQRPEFVVLAIDPADVGSPAIAGVERWSERDDVAAAWLTSHNIAGVIVRPDQYVFGGFATVADLAELLGLFP